MAKINSVITFVGKLDNVVGMKGDKGETYARKHLREINNPSTDAQVDQRLKVSLAGQISNLTPAGAIVGMKGANKRQRRANFVKNIINKAQITNNADDTKNANLTRGSLILSEGQVVAIPTMTAALSGNNVTVTASQWPVGSPVVGVLLVAYGIEDGRYVTCKAATLGLGESSVIITLPRLDASAGLATAVYAIPLIPAAGRSVNDYEEGVLEVNTDFSVAFIGNATNNVEYGRSAEVPLNQA